MKQRRSTFEQTRRAQQHIQFLYYEDCPSYQQALGRLQQVLDEEGIATGIEIIQVRTEEQARQLRFAGSPTILINGHDIVATESEPHYALTCRAYHLEDGRISPLPSVALLRNALYAAQDSSIWFRQESEEEECLS